MTSRPWSISIAGCWRVARVGHRRASARGTGAARPGRCRRRVGLVDRQRRIVVREVVRRRDLAGSPGRARGPACRRRLRSPSCPTARARSGRPARRSAVDDLLHPRQQPLQPLLGAAAGVAVPDVAQHAAPSCARRACAAPPAPATRRSPSRSGPGLWSRSRTVSPGAVVVLSRLHPNPSCFPQRGSGTVSPRRLGTDHPQRRPAEEGADVLDGVAEEHPVGLPGDVPQVRREHRPGQRCARGDPAAAAPGRRRRDRPRRCAPRRRASHQRRFVHDRAPGWC